MPRTWLPSSERRVPEGTWWNLLATGVQKPPRALTGAHQGWEQGAQDSSGWVSPGWLETVLLTTARSIMFIDATTPPLQRGVLWLLGAGGSLCCDLGPFTGKEHLHDQNNRNHFSSLSERASHGLVRAWSHGKRGAAGEPRRACTGHPKPCTACGEGQSTAEECPHFCSLEVENLRGGGGSSEGRQGASPPLAMGALPGPVPAHTSGPILHHCLALM